jgi:hypothetical protein
MDRMQKWVLIAALTVIGLVIVPFVVPCVSASPGEPNAPLYIHRMEQVSYGMNFLSTQVNNFIYTTEKGYTVNYDVAGCCNGARAPPTNLTCVGSCFNTCSNCGDTWYTCGYTCWNTCKNTCWNTCKNTCWNTCLNYTCWDTCAGWTCWTCWTCLVTCHGTCDGTCEHTRFHCLIWQG